MQRPLSEYHTLRAGYERQRQQEYETWLLHVARLRTTSFHLMHSLKGYLMMRKRTAEQIQHPVAIRFDNTTPLSK